METIGTTFMSLLAAAILTIVGYLWKRAEERMERIEKLLGEQAAFIVMARKILEPFERSRDAAYDDFVRTRYPDSGGEPPRRRYTEGGE